MADLPEHVARNQVYWDGLAGEYVDDGRRNWESEEPTWGLFSVPESEVGMLPAQIEGRDSIELGWAGRSMRQPSSRTTRSPLLTRSRTAAGGLSGSSEKSPPLRTLGRSTSNSSKRSTSAGSRPPSPPTRESSERRWCSTGRAPRSRSRRSSLRSTTLAKTGTGGETTCDRPTTRSSSNRLSRPTLSPCASTTSIRSSTETRGRPGTSATRRSTRSFPRNSICRNYLGETQSGRTATHLVQPAEAAVILTGKQITVKPVGDSCSRPWSFSSWQ
jgi:hypothetical protein